MIMKFLRFLALLFLVYNATSQEIEEMSDMLGYENYPQVERSYKFYDTIMTWNEARKFCRSESAELAMPMNKDEAAILKTIFNTHPMSSIKGRYPNRTLLNFHDQFQMGEFVIETGDTVQYAFHEWSKGEPKMDKERCGSMDRNGLIDDFPCDQKTSFICQKGAGHGWIAPDEKCSPIDPEYREFNNKCYKYHIEPKTWPEARAICHAEGGFLAIIVNKEEEDHLVSLINKPQYKVTHAPCSCCALIGFHDRFEEGEYMAVSGQTLKEIGYINWYKGNPSNKRGWEDCGALNKEGGFDDVYCDLPAPFICQRTVQFDVRRNDEEIDPRSEIF